MNTKRDYSRIFRFFLLCLLVLNLEKQAAAQGALPSSPEAQRPPPLCPYNQGLVLDHSTVKCMPCTGLELHIYSNTANDFNILTQFGEKQMLYMKPRMTGDLYAVLERWVNRRNNWWSAALKLRDDTYTMLAGLTPPITGERAAGIVSSTMNAQMGVFELERLNPATGQPVLLGMGGQIWNMIYQTNRIKDAKYYMWVDQLYMVGENNANEDPRYWDLNAFTTGNDNLVNDPIWKWVRDLEAAHYGIPNFPRDSGYVREYIYLDAAGGLVSRRIPRTQDDILCPAAGNVGQYTPVSVVFDETAFKTEVPTKADFSLDPSRPKAYSLWKASSIAPLLVARPSNVKGQVKLEELFGPWYAAGRGGTTFHDGFEALATFDTDKNGKVEHGELKNLSLWFDRNRDGITDAGELRSAKEFGITSLTIAASTVDGGTDRWLKNSVHGQKAGKHFTAHLVDWDTFVSDSKESL